MSLRLLRQQVDDLRNDRSSWISHWRDIQDVLMPRRGRFLGSANSQANRGDKRHQAIIDNTATSALRSLASGMMTGMTSPARPWFNLAVRDPKLSELPQVKLWLSETTQAMRAVFSRSNLYTTLHTLYHDLGAFGTAVMLVVEDDASVIRCECLPIGSWMLATDAQGRVDMLAHEHSMTVRQIVEKFGIDACSSRVQELHRTEKHHEKINVTWVVKPNDEHRAESALPKYKRWLSCYYETDSRLDDDVEKALSRSGFDSFPAMAPRWSVTGEDVYGSGPGMDALGDIRALQFLQKMKAQGIEKTVTPPLQGPAELRNSVVSSLPGGLTTLANATQGISPLYQVNLPMQYLLQDISEHQQRINDTFLATLFRMFAGLERQVTAEEVRARQQELLLQAGPVIDRLGAELLNPLIDRVFDIMLKRGALSEPPEELQGIDLDIEYVSLMAQAQKQAGNGAISAVIGFASNILAVSQDPTMVEKIDFDEALKEFAEGAGVTPKVLRSDEEVAARREAREKAAAMQQHADVLATGAKAARDLAGASLDTNNALNALTQQ